MTQSNLVFIETLLLTLRRTSFNIDIRNQNFNSMTSFNNCTFHIQNFYSDGEVRPNIANQTTDIPSELDTPKAKELWKIAQDKGWVDDTLYPLIPMSKASILAATISEKLVLVYKWKPFEILWNTQNCLILK